MKVKGLEAQKIIKVACGKDVTFALSDRNELFSWGCGLHGMLGHGDTEDYEFPGRIIMLDDKNIIGISTGGAHCCAWSSDGRIYSWGRGRGFFFLLFLLFFFFYFFLLFLILNFFILLIVFFNLF